MHIVKQKITHQPGIEVKSDMKILLEIEYASGADGLTNRLSLGSYVEEVMPDGCILIQMPVHRGYNHPLPRDEPILMYLLSKTFMYSMTVLFMERVQRGRLLFTKMRGCSDMKPDQRRACYRLAGTDLKSREGNLVPVRVRPRAVLIRFGITGFSI